MKVVITGGTGFIGRSLQDKLLSLNHLVIVLTRSSRKSNINNLSYSTWNVDKGIIDEEEICSADAIIHLTGANIADGKWTLEQKQTIVDSRVKTANLLFNTLKNNRHNVTSFISASGSNSYGLKTTSTVFKETDDYGTDFLGKVCQLWEKAALQFSKLGIRTVCLRTGVVFAKKDSALQKISKPISFGCGSPLGSGKQIMSIIHIEDLCNLYIAAVQNESISGVYNSVAVNETNAEVTKKIAKVLNRPVFLPNVPAFVLKIVFGEMATILLKGSAVDNTKIKQTGFQFQYPSLEAILKDVL